MKKVVTTQQTLSVNELKNLILQNKVSVIFYRVNNEPNGIPVFFKEDTTGHCYFMSPVISRSKSHASNSVRECITLAAASRQLYVIDDKDDLKEIFVNC